MAVYVTNRARFRALSCYVGGGTPPTGLSILLLGGTTGSHSFSQAEVDDVDTVSDLLALSNVQECAASGYSRQSLASVAVTQDDTDNRGEADAADVAFGALSTGDTIRGLAIYEDGASDAARNLILVQDALNVPTNGSTVTVTIADFLRAS